MNARDRRFAENEMLFRSVNERIEALGEELASDVPVGDFVCECTDADCAAKIPMTHSEYEHVRADGRRFVVAPGAEHVNLEIETVVERTARYWLVEKEDEAGELADAGDPRG